MQSPMKFILEKNGILELNEEVLNLIENSKNPNFLLFYGQTRKGKSTTLNQLIRGNHETWKFKNKKPFYALDSLKSITKGCEIFGPVKASSLIKNHLLTIDLEEDFDVFFCDTEGISSLDGIDKKAISGILVLLQLCTIAVNICHRVCINEDLKELCSQIQISRIIKNINNNLSSPLTILYISNIFYGGGDNYNNEDEEENYEKLKNLYEISRQNQKTKLLEEINEKYKLNIKENDIEVIPGGKYQNIKHEKEPDHDDPFVKLYWDSIKEILIKFINAKKNNDPKQIVIWIRFLFNIFKNLKSINDDFNLENFLINYLSNSFEEFAKKQFEIKKNKIREELNDKLVEYINILKNDENAKKSLKDCLDKKYVDIFYKLIPEKVNSFFNLSLEQYRALIKEEIEYKFNSICNEILLVKNINELIKDIIDIINNSEFKEDIDFMKIKINNEKIWNNIYEKNKIIFEYFKETKKFVLTNLKGDLLSKIDIIINNLINKKIKWEDYFKDKMNIIDNDINESLQEFFKHCYYKEDFEIYKSKYEEYYNLIYNKFYNQIKKKFFNNISSKRQKQFYKYINNIFKEKYDNIINNNNYKIWKDIKSEIIVSIREIFDSYILKIFHNKEFRDDINLNLRNKNVFLNTLPFNIIEKYQIQKEKEKEINMLINSEIDNYIQIFNKKLNNLPLFDNFIKELLNKYNILINKEIEWIINKFYYIEDKIDFDTNKIFLFITKNNNIYKGANTKITEINIKLREFCNKKANEYLDIISKKKPEWKKIKKQKILMAEKLLKNFVEKVFKDVCYKEDAKIVKKEDLKILIIKSEDIYKNIQPNKINELELAIDNIINKNIDDIKRKINTLPDWNVIKSILLQDAIIEMENCLKLNIKQKINNYKSPLVDEFDIIVEIILSKVNEKKLLNQCLNKERRNELMKEILEKAKEITENYIKKEKIKKIEEEKREEEIKSLEEIIKILKDETEEERKEREKIEKMIGEKKI